MHTPYPLVFEPIFMPKVWGGRRLERIGKSLPPGQLVGESWELADLAATSASGGGGGAARSVVANGPLAGQTLHDALIAWGTRLVGSAALARDGGFPLLVKFLDARENLSVQVHPSPAYAAAHPGTNLKTESWFILDAEPKSVVYKGIRQGVTREDFARHIQDGTVVNDLIAVPAVPGECHNLPSGTCHALGAGVLVAEVQTPSDTTFRVFDWGRVGRELHVEQSLECIDFGPAPAAACLESTSRGGKLVTTEFFELSEFKPRGQELSGEEAFGGRCACVMTLKGNVTLHTEHGAAVELPAGRTGLVPAIVSAATRVRSTADSTFLVATLPRA
jgi:mannose-6-phosphate isomerase